MSDRIFLFRPTGFRQTLGAGLCALAMVATVGGALAFQHIGGFLPCQLCVEQRTPYYVAIPVAVAAFAFAYTRAPAVLTRTALLAVGGLMLWALWLGVVHAGVEWGWWPGPADCGLAGDFDLTGGNLLAQLDTVRGPSCDEAALRIFGLSLAGWNAVIAVVLAAVALRAALTRGDRFAGPAAG